MAAPGCDRIYADAPLAFAAMTDIGSTLREARMRDRIDISEVETRTKIRAKYLRAIENEEWDLLPGPVYAKSFLRTYGDFLGLDSRMLIDEFKRQYERPNDQDIRPSTSIARERERRRRGPRFPTWAPIAVVVAGDHRGAVRWSAARRSRARARRAPTGPAHHHPPHHATPVRTTTAAKPTERHAGARRPRAPYTCAS